ncbi:unnamed protein product [Rhizophagus irregularis]|nr:unnamed protein product [Rhizophagus irregularis]CAB5344317.1 unnamed protein product [Rhizophagus irregularis]
MIPFGQFQGKIQEPSINDECGMKGIIMIERNLEEIRQDINLQDANGVLKKNLQELSTDGTKYSQDVLSLFDLLKSEYHPVTRLTMISCMDNIIKDCRSTDYRPSK